MTTSITRPPWVDVRTPQQKQEAALLVAFHRLTPKGQMMAFKAAKRLRAANPSTRTGASI